MNVITFFLFAGLLFAQDNIVQPTIIHKVVPEYPENAKKLRVEAKIFLQALLSIEGVVIETKLMQAHITIPGSTITIYSIDDLKKIVSSHRNSAAKLLEIAHHTAKKWKFTPATINGKAEESTVVLPFSFNLVNESKVIPKERNRK